MERARSIPAVQPPQSTPVERDLRVAAIARAQWGVISLAQLTRLGVSERTVRDWVARGRLHRRHRGVYAVGHDVVPWKGLIMGSVLACGPDAAASHTTAGRVGGLCERAGRLHVTIPGRRVRIRGIDTHRTRRWEPGDVTIEQGIRCTTWDRTICDVAALTRDARLVERMIDRAEQLRLFDLHVIRRRLERRPHTSGAPIVRAALGLPRSAMTRSEMEERVLAICDGIGAPRPRVNEPLVLDDGTHLVPDFAWPELKRIVETDGWETHGTRRAFASDRRRDRKLALEGWRVLRYTWHEIEHEPARVAEELAVALAPAS